MQQNLSTLVLSSLYMAIDVLSTNFQKHTSKNPLQKFLIENFYRNLIELSRPLKPVNILDAGCGEGFSLNKLSENKIGKKLEGIENSKTAIILSKKINPNLNIKFGSVYKLPYKNNSFDLVICTEVLEHLENPEKALKELARVSKQYLLLTVPNEPFFMVSNLLRGKNVKRFGNDQGHLNHWNVYSFNKFLKENSIKIKEVKFPFPWIMVLAKK